MLRPSLLDRLIGDEATGGRAPRASVGLRELHLAVARDLEWLLNTRAWVPYEELGELRHARDSILTYGFPDLSGRSWSNPSDAQEVAGLIEETIRRFEPRLLPRSVKVAVLPRRDVDDFSLSFRIEAVLHIEPLSEPVAFDTDVDFDTRAVRVRGSE